MKETDSELRAQIDALIRDEIQDNINEYVEQKEEGEKGGLGFVGKDEDEQLKVNIPQAEIDKIIRDYKKIKKRRKSNLYQAKLLDKHGKPLK